jgi:hypothetical protein
MMKHQGMIKLILGLAIMIAAALYESTALTSKSKTSGAGSTNNLAPFMQTGPVIGKANNGWLSQAALPSRLHTALRALGDRLERRGKERLVMAGILRYFGESLDTPFTLILELPGRVQLALQQGVSSRTLVYDCENLQSPDNIENPRDREAIETLVYDSAEHLLLGQIEGAMSTRFLGERFHLDNGTESLFYDVFEAVDQIRFKQETREQKKVYCFNASSHLLDRIIYQGQSDNIAREVRLSDWREIAGQQVPCRIERLEGQTTSLQFFIQTVAIGPRLNDGAFAIPK